MSPHAQAESAERAQTMLAALRLQQLRQSRQITQVELAQALRIEQAAVSKLEHRDDMYLSTLRDYVRALGGDLRLVATFPDGDVELRPWGVEG